MTVELNIQTLTKMASAIKILSADAVEKAKSGHPGMPIGMAEVATALFTNALVFYAPDAKWQNRDRLVLSAGHGSMLLYSLLYLTGYNDIDIEDLKDFRQLKAKCAGHPEFAHLQGIETTTGPLGQGIGNAVGFALAEKMQQARFSKEFVDHYTYVICGDGCLMEGISHEAASLAGHLKLNKLIILFDDNNISIDGPTDLAVSDNHLQRFEAYGFACRRIDGHNFEEIFQALEWAKNNDKPSFIACKTIIAKGAPNKAGSSSSHGSPLGVDEVAGLRNNLSWSYPSFVVPEDILSLWRQIGVQHKAQYEQWQLSLDKSTEKTRFFASYSKDLDQDLTIAIGDMKRKLSENRPLEATRKSSGNVLNMLSQYVDNFVGGSADLTGSNDTKAKNMKPLTFNDFTGNYVYYGVREHAMAAIMNGLSLYGCFRPYGGTFLVFADYLRPAMRLSALMEQPVVYVMTHDSIGLGEDGPTHQPVEHLASIRAMPNVVLMRPADATETLECWEVALKNTKTPSVLSLTRQNVTHHRNQYTQENMCEKGAYILKEAQGDLKISLFASGSEVSIAIDAANKLDIAGFGARVISVPSFELFWQQDSSYITSLLCNDSLKVAVEAACEFGWHNFIGAHGFFVGMKGFGSSAPAEQLYEHFEITAENIVEKVLSKVKR